MKTCFKNGFYKWDGTTKDGKKAHIGVYIIVVERNNLSGKSQKYKRTCTLARRNG